MFYDALADVVTVVHFVFILYLVLGGLLAFKWFKNIYIHIPALFWGAYVEISGTICPLTPLENWLRQQVQKQGYEGSFIEHYIVPVIYPEALSRSDQLILAAALIVLNIVIYSAVLFNRQLLKT